MLLECAIGDAYGIGFEFVPHSDDRPITLDRYYSHPKYGLPAGHYTDDTQRSLANAEVVLEGRHLDAAAYADAYVKVFARDRRDGYSRRYQAFLEAHPDPIRFLDNIKPDAISNGSLMGAAPLGYVASLRQCAQAAGIQAMLTHSYQTIPYAQAIALSAHYFIYDLGPRSELVDFLREYALDDPYPFRLAPPVKDMSAKATWRSIIEIITTYDDLTSMLRAAVEMGGDTDSVAAASLAIASCSKEVEQKLPARLVTGLENGDYGRDFLVAIDDQLAAYAERHRKLA